MYNLDDVEKLSNNEAFIRHLNNILFKVYLIKYQNEFLDDEVIEFNMIIN